MLLFLLLLLVVVVVDDDDDEIYPIHRFPKSCIFNETNAKKTVSTGKVLGFGVHGTCQPASQHVH